MCNRVEVYSLIYFIVNLDARSSIAGWDTILQAGRLRVRDAKRSLNFSIYPVLAAALGPGVYSDSNRNEYQKQKNNISGEESVPGAKGWQPTTSPPSVSRLSRQCGTLNISQPYRPARSVTGIALFYGGGVCFLWGTNWTVNTATSSQYLAVNCEPIV
jgi:hypothetical protein